MGAKMGESGAAEGERYRRLKRAFTELRELPEAERAARASDLCGGDAALLAELEALLRADAGETLFGPGDAVLRSIGDAAWAVGTGTSGAAEETPERIGPFRVEGLIAQGGMAAVYRATQEHPGRTVAIKLIRPGPGSGGLLARLDREADLLARLQHPNIAQVFDAGRFDSGLGKLPYLVMEYVEGAPIDVAARERGLGIEERVRLLVEVARAVEHAHQRGVIHRDLKPANVMLTPEGRVKVLDFGVARLLDEEHGTATVHTRPGQLVGTVRYMSPEQAGGRPQDVDTRTDVYGLGVLAYELLGGRAAFDVDDLTVLEAARVVREQSPARLGQVEAGARGDLETIVAKAMEKDKERRYASASEFAADLERYLSDEPVLARRASGVYLARKFVRRHRGPVAGAAMAVLALVAGTAFASWQAVERSKEAARLRAVNTFWNELFRSPNPGESSLEEGSVDVTVAAYLEEASERLGEAYAGQPAVEAELRATIGATYLVMDDFARALPELERAWMLQADLFGAHDRRTLLGRVQIAEALVGLTRHEEAETMLRETLGWIEKAAGPNSEEAVVCVNLLSSLSVYSGDMEGVTSWTEEAVARIRAGGLERTSAGANALTNLGWQRMRRADPEAARALLEEALVSWERVDDTSADLERLGVMQHLAELEWRGGRFARAAELLDEVVRVHLERFGPLNGRTLNAMANRAQVRFSAGEQEEGLAELEQVMEAYRSAGSEGGALATKYTLGRLLLLAGRYERGAAVNSEAFQRYEELRGPEAIATMVALNHWAVCVREQGKLEEAAPLYESLLERVDRVFGEAPDGREAALRGSAAKFFVQAGQYEQAEKQLLRSYEIRAGLSAPGAGKEVAAELAAVYEAWNRRVEAAHWRAVAEGE